MTEMTALEKKRQEKIDEMKISDEDMDAFIPKPVGYRILIALPNVEETFGDSGLIKADQTKREEYILSTIGAVVDMGAEAYSDKDRFVNGP